MAWPAFLIPQWVDAVGGTSEPFMSIYPQASAVLTPYNQLLAAMQAMSACQLRAAVLQLANTYPGASGSSSHPQASDQLRIQVSNGARTGFVTIPGPIDSIFLSDSVTLDLTNPLVVALKSQLIAVLGDTTGASWTAIVAGARRRVAQGQGSEG